MLLQMGFIIWEIWTGFQQFFLCLGTLLLPLRFAAISRTSGANVSWPYCASFFKLSFCDLLGVSSCVCLLLGFRLRRHHSVCTASAQWLCIGKKPPTGLEDMKLQQVSWKWRARRRSDSLILIASYCTSLSLQGSVGSCSWRWALHSSFSLWTCFRLWLQCQARFEDLMHIVTLCIKITSGLCALKPLHGQLWIRRTLPLQGSAWHWWRGPRVGHFSNGRISDCGHSQHFVILWYPLHSSLAADTAEIAIWKKKARSTNSYKFHVYDNRVCNIYQYISIAACAFLHALSFDTEGAGSKLPGWTASKVSKLWRPGMRGRCDFLAMKW